MLNPERYHGSGRSRRAGGVRVNGVNRVGGVRAINVVPTACRSVVVWGTEATQRQRRI